MTTRALQRALLLAAAAVTAAASPLLADWLVMKDGSGRFETKGPWEVRGNQVVFYRANGTLSSMRAADVDLDASKQATESAAHPQPTAAPTPAEPKKPALVLTDKDVAHVSPEAAPAATGAATASAPAAAGPVDRVRVTEWHQDLSDVTRGVTLVGNIANSSNDLVGDIHVTARLIDEKGKEIATTGAMLGTTTLQPGASTNMRVNFPGVFNFKDVRFEPKSLALRTMRQPAKP